MIGNLITLSRVILTFIVNHYILFHFGKVGIPLLLFGMVFLTDYMDGKIARLSKTVSPGGAVFDLLADFFFIFLTYLVLYYLQIMPLWFIGVVFGKFVEFVFTSIILSKSDPGNGVFVFDFIGRFVAAMFYAYPVLLYFSYCFSPVMYTLCISILAYFLLIFALLSSAYRIRNCFRLLKGLS